MDEEIGTTKREHADRACVIGALVKRPSKRDAVGLYLVRYRYEQDPARRAHALDAHVEYLKREAERGTVIAAGAVHDGDFGYVLIRCDSIRTATVIAEADPVIALGGASFDAPLEWVVDIGLPPMTETAATNP